MKTKFLFPLLALCAAGVLHADTITTTSGDVINGTITGKKGGKISIETTFAGTIAIDEALIKTVDYTTSEQLYARTDASHKDKELVTVSKDAQGNVILIPEEDKAKALALTEVVTLWDTESEDPDFPAIKRWAYSVSLGLSGNSGTANDISISAYADAVRTGENTTFKVYGSMNKTRSEGVETAKRYIGGLDFEHRPTDVLSWYIRDEVQHNRYSDYKLRNVLGAGAGFYLWNTTTEGRQSLLRFRLGLAHTYTNHYTRKWANSRETLVDSDIALDLGLLFHYDFTSGLSWNTEVTYTPLIDDLDKGILVHETKLSYLMNDLALVYEQLSGISVDMGVRNEYQTRPAPGKCHTDTSWFVRFSKAW